MSKLKQPIELYDQVILVLLPSLNYSYYLGTFIKYYKISQLIHTQSIAN